HNSFRHMDGSVMNARLSIDGRRIVDKFGMLDPSFLNEPEVVRVAREFGDPDELLAPVSHAAHGSGTLW
ncbi:MAG: hypothetical protein ACREFQ_13310, partial [Stellaceae bacterium]